MNRKILVIATLSFLAGALIFGIFSTVFAQNNFGEIGKSAGFFEDIFNNYIKPIFTKPAEIINSAKEQIEQKKEEPQISSQNEIYSPTVDYEEAVVAAVEKASPAVVSIIISKDVPVIERCPANSPFSDLPAEFKDFFGDQQFYTNCQKGTKLQEIGGGSGFIISADGYVVTNKHVAEDAKALYSVFTNDGKKYEAKIISLDPAKDFAVLKISGNNFPILKLGNSDSIKLGQTAIAIGNALSEFRNTVSVGVVSGLARNITASDGLKNEKIEGVIQTDAAINPGNSGGPLLNLKGEVIGINVATVSGAQGISFAIPINQVKNSIQSVKDNGRIVSPYLGVKYLLIDENIAKEKNLPVKEGALINSSDNSSAVISNSPASKAGLLSGDIIISLNNEKITTDKSLGMLIQKYKVGEEIALKILRNKKEIIVKVILEERPVE